MSAADLTTSIPTPVAPHGYAPRCFALVPAAGVGSRSGADRPKQYVPLAGQAMMAHTLAALAAVRGRLATLIDSPLVPLTEIPSPELSDEAFINASALYLNMRGPLRQNLLELGSTLMRGQKLVELLESR